MQQRLLEDGPDDQDGPDDRRIDGNGRDTAKYEQLLI